MKKKYNFFVAGRARNKDNILKVCDVLDEMGFNYYCFLKCEDSYGSYGKKGQTAEEKQKEFENLDLKNELVLKVFKEDLEAEKDSENFFISFTSRKILSYRSRYCLWARKKMLCNRRV